MESINIHISSQNKNIWENLNNLWILYIFYECMKLFLFWAIIIGFELACTKELFWSALMSPRLF